MIDYILEKLPKINEQDLSNLVNIIKQSEKFDNFTNNQVANNKFEIDYANFLGTQNQDFVSIYREVVVEACYAEFLEWYEYLSKHILRKDVQKILQIDFDATNTDWEYEFKKSKLLGWAYHNQDTQNFLDNINKVAELGNIMKEFFNARKPLSTLDDDYFESDHAQLVLDSINKIIIKNDTHELLDHLHTDKILCMIEVYGWDNRFNPILLEWICNNRQKVSAWN